MRSNLFATGFGCHKLATFKCTSCPPNSEGKSLESTGCKCKTGFGGQIVAKDNGYYFSGGYDGVCVSKSLTCGENIGFNARANSHTRGSGWQEITTWITAGNPTLYNAGDYLDQKSGRFGPPVDGYYLCSTQVRIDSFSSSYTRLMIAINGNRDTGNGMHVIEGDYGDTDYRAMSVTGVIKISQGSYVSVWIESVSDNSWTLQSESGFSCHKLNNAMGFHASKKGGQSMATQWAPVGVCLFWLPKCLTQIYNNVACIDIIKSVVISFLLCFLLAL